MASTTLTDILQWAKQQPAWQQDALRRLFVVGDLAPADFDALTEICKSKYGLASQSAEPLSADHVPVSEGGSANAVALISVTHQGGVNALAANQTVSFGQNLTIVYGENAAGKSGYTRLLKAACRSRVVEQILGNVLSKSAPLKANATIRIREGVNELDVAWTLGASPSSSLAQVSVFDGHCVPVYLRDKTDVAFRPFGLDLFDKLAVACLEVKKRLENESLQLGASLLPPTPHIAVGTKVRNFLDTLSGLTKDTDVLTLAKLSDLERNRLTELREMKRDLEAADPKKRAQELAAKADRIERAAEHAKSVVTVLGLQSLKQLIDAREDLKSARSALDTLRKTTFTPELLTGTGGGRWRQMWDAALAFAHESTPSLDFEHAEGAKCPVCQQELQADAASRLKHFAAFIKSTAQQEADAAAANYAARRKDILALAIDRPEIAATLSEVTVDQPAFEQRADQFFATAKTLRDGVEKFTDSGDNLLMGMTFDPSFEKDLRAISDALRVRVLQLQGTAKTLSTAEQKELAELEARDALGLIVDSVLAEIHRKRKIAALAQCIADTGTGAVTKKSTELTKLLITDQLQKTFQSELQKVDFTHLSVGIQPAGGSKGILFHKLTFSNAPGVKVTDVLSEGESRALSLAAFITELSTAPTRSGIIFDDPVSSLDHQWRERIGKRLVAEAIKRQVIVFTHDLLFLRILISESEKSGVPFTHQYIRREGAAGICSPDLPWVAMNVNSRIKVLRVRWDAANKLAASGQTDAYESATREIFGLLRETWERGVSEVLLNDVVERYRPSIETKKVAKLHDITEADCKAVDAGMTAASRWILGHDEALADGTPFPKPVEVKQHIDALEGWAKEIRKRRDGKKAS